MRRKGQQTVAVSMVSIGNLEGQTANKMMSKEEYLAKAAARYETIEKLKDQKDFYNYEADFDKIWNDLGREVLESSISKVPTNRRKKTASGSASGQSK
jgi:hypothetical protein